jgi:hypothetical protein
VLVITMVVGASVVAGLLSRWGPRAQTIPSPGAAAFPPVPAGASVFETPFAAYRPPVPPTPLPVVAPPIPVVPAIPIPPFFRRSTPSKGMIPIFIAVLLLIFCMNAFHFMYKPASVLLLVGVVAVTAHMLTKNRGGILSNASSSIGGDIASASASMAGLASSVARGVAGLIGSILLIASIFLALSVSINVPGLLEHGILDVRMPYEIERAVGTPQWPRLLSEGATAVCVVLSMSSTVFLLTARRRGGGGHMMRGVLGVAVLLGGAVAMGKAMPDLGDVMRAATPADTVDQYFQRVQFTDVVRASSVFLVGAVLLGWPARRNPRPALIPPIAPVGPAAVEKEPAK